MIFSLEELAVCINNQDTGYIILVSIEIVCFYYLKETMSNDFFFNG